MAAAAADAKPCRGRAGFVLVFHIFMASRTVPPCFSSVGTESIWHEDKRRTKDCQGSSKRSAAPSLVPDELLMAVFGGIHYTWAQLALDLKNKTT